MSSVGTHGVAVGSRRDPVTLSGEIPHIKRAIGGTHIRDGTDLKHRSAALEVVKQRSIVHRIGIASKPN